MDIIATKIVVALLFGAIRFIFGVLPIYVCRWLKIGGLEGGRRTAKERKRRALDCCIALVQSFGGGVLFATSFLHMMPEVYFSVEELRNYGMLSADYPYSQLVVSIGFFLVYFLEEMSHWLVSRMPKEPCRTKKKIRTESTSSIVPKDNKVSPHFIKLPEEKDMVVNEEVQTDDHMAFEDDQINAELEEIIEEEAKSQQQILRCILIVLALSFHAIFEGLAIGLQHSTTSIWYLFIAVSVHSATILFCIGLEIYLGGSKPKTIVIHMILLAITSPLGVFFGLTISVTTEMHTSAKSFAVVVLEGLSAGTILYITFFEVLSREKERRIYRFRRAAFIGAGFALMAGLECIKIS